MNTYFFIENEKWRTTPYATTPLLHYPIFSDDIKAEQKRKTCSFFFFVAKEMCPLFGIYNIKKYSEKKSKNAAISGLKNGGSEKWRSGVVRHSQKTGGNYV